MVVEWLCPGLRPTRSNRPRLLHCKVILLDEHELLQDVLVSSASLSRFSRLFAKYTTIRNGRPSPARLFALSRIISRRKTPILRDGREIPIRESSCIYTRNTNSNCRTEAAPRRAVIRARTKIPRTTSSYNLVD